MDWKKDSKQAESSEMSSSPVSEETRVQLKGKGLQEQQEALAPAAHGYDVQQEARVPVQQDGAGRAAGVHAAAARGTSGAGSSLPHLDRIQDSFGSHDVSGVQAFTGGAAKEDSASMGANAYATGNKVAFGASPSLHTAAHEAAHVVQQRAGVSLANGVGQSGDSYEQHADKVADAVVQGKSAEGLLDQYAGKNGGGTGQVQRAAKETSGGTFTDEKYDIEGRKLHMAMKFRPGDGVEATKIGLIQSVKAVKAGSSNAIDPAARERTTSDGVKIDRLTNRNTPVYGSRDLPAGKGLEDTAPDNNRSSNPTELNPDAGRNATYQLGYRIGPGPVYETKDAGLYDGPTLYNEPDSYKEFETAAVALDGEQKGMYYGSVRWGWKRDSAGSVSKYDFDVVSEGVPSAQFLEAGEKFNSAKTRGSCVAKVNGTSFYNLRVQEEFKINTDVTMKQLSTHSSSIGSIIKVEITSEGPNKGREGFVKVSDVQDAGDGDALNQVPLVDVSLTTGMFTPLFKEPLLGVEEAQLPMATRVRILNTLEHAAEVRVVDGPFTGKTGFIEAGTLREE